MVRRRRPSGVGANKPSKPRGVNPKDARLDKWNTEEDIPMDDIDLFHAGRDKILLDGTDSERRRDLEDYDDEEEVFGMKGVGVDDDDYREEDYSDEGDDKYGSESEELPAGTKSSKSKATKSKKIKTSAKKDEDSGSGDADSESEEERWGKSKSAYYVSAATDAIDSDDEAAQALEVKEARRLQAKARDVISEDGYGIEEVLEVPERGQDDTTNVLEQDVPDAGALLAQDKGSLLRHLEKTSPETLALAREWDDVSRDLRKVEAAISSQTSEDENDPRLALVHLHHQSLLTYGTILAYYLYIRSTPVPGSTPNAPTTAEEVPQKVVDRLYQLKSALSILEDLGFSAIRDDEDEDVFDDQSSGSETPESRPQYRLSEAEMKDLIAEMEKFRGENDSRNNVRRQRMKRAKEKKAGGSVADSDNLKKGNKKMTVESSMPPKTKSSFDLEEPEFVPSKPSAPTLPISSPFANEELSVFGEARSIDVHVAKEKADRKHSLRFHTSKIERSERRREGKRRHAMGGDDDVPYRNTKVDSVPEKVPKESMDQEGDDLDPDAPDEGANMRPVEGKKRSRVSLDDSIADVGAGDEGYYELVKRQKREVKEQRRATFETVQAISGSRTDVSEEGLDGKPRSATAAILKNRGLTPKRSKVVRNPRVKKKLQYDKANKRMASKKAVFKGGLANLPGGRYEGEKSGISKVVKSVKLG